jgi:hypothetical protein
VIADWLRDQLQAADVKVLKKDDVVTTARARSTDLCNKP